LEVKSMLSCVGVAMRVELI